MTIFIGGAWPYANGSLHLGHIAGLLPGDILARYFRLKGEEVLYVSGSDCHGTPIAIRAWQENVSPGSISERYHKEFDDCFRRLGFSYDIYSRTDGPYHAGVVRELFLELYKKGCIYEKTVEQTFCESCGKFLPDRYIEGRCPHCGNTARGDQCDFCSSLLEPGDLLDKKCRLCGSTPVIKPAKQLFFTLSGFQADLEALMDKGAGWRENAVNLTRRYLNEGLQDRAVTRDLSWGISVPIEGYEDKIIYVWIEAVCGYLSASRQWAQENGTGWERFWSEDVTAYYVHGKDNIPFHTIILPALLKGAGNLHLPDCIISSEYLTIEGKKLSTSRNWAIWVPYILDNYNPDSVRYFLTINGPEKRDADFSWREFVNRHNGELLGAFGNFVNRSLVFIHRFFDGRVPCSEPNRDFARQLSELYHSAGESIEKGEFKHALESIFAAVRNANKYFDEQQPWIQAKSDPQGCARTLNTCVQIIANLANLLTPFIPFSCDRIRDILYIDRAEWRYTGIEALRQVKQPAILFERIDRGVAERELAKLGTN